MSMSSSRISDDSEAILKDLKIPPAPDIILQLQQELREEAPSLDAIGDIIQKDAAISGLVLKTVNSPLFGLRATIQSIPQAIMLLGFSYVGNIVQGLVLRQTLGQGDALPPRFWGSSSNRALLMAALSTHLLDCSADQAYLLGLFHDVGQAMIAQRQSDYADFIAANDNDPDHALTRLEDEFYNFNHASVGFYLARNWGLPEGIRNIILHHHQSSEFLERDDGDDCEQAMMAVLKMAEHIERGHAGIDPDHEWGREQEAVLGYLGMSEVDFEDLRVDLLDRLMLELN